MYVCLAGNVEDVPQMVQNALALEASALLLPVEAEEVMQGMEIPPGVPVKYVSSVADVAHRLAVAFYGAFMHAQACVHSDRTTWMHACVHANVCQTAQQKLRSGTSCRHYCLLAPLPPV